VYESGGIQRVIAVPATSLPLRELVKLIVHKRKHGIEGAAIARPQLLQKSGHRLLLNVAHLGQALDIGEALRT
jgi:hypothetical protein